MPSLACERHNGSLVSAPSPIDVILARKETSKQMASSSASSGAAAAVRFVASAGNNKSIPRIGSLYLQLRVKPGTSRQREGISSVTGDRIELCVAAPARDGAANEAVVRLLGDAIRLPKTRLLLVQGAKCRDKTVVVRDVAEDGAGAYAATVLDLLRKASRNP
ncbi:hypothetical protein JDV02_003758 [Purpureocillium takamizusanense]|uniref:Uncharacterized protein n=1 Tax=Purpureocillium takamizusanense TaxID=2060973 RepID=A0A9Q8QD28_9HYPO|nr:uncharacterized protein JDV02_003758 [Purpureocillium takamizusanense]UNI17415.1 hypothetical protein JDV02_003758 [Purpureocillium takamizusanense]